ncbi:S-layer homology domain-containing protein [Gloeobacter morelensis]|uniref:S-layer homology domain-containing protein n=1 Tax=Gloeobacter morelensis MG652769 TaxID=2781736 RepID=A0ABY3PS06_9CYAN|nr:S-layer homology domain-containing protein [Gloeobacter morelensis]UFP96497.1 S-layer homology domain-containing protein [Gloeobacter morelensis MG652769]
MGASLATGAQAAQFKDIAGYWGASYVDTLADRRFIAGFPDGTFRPDAPVTRAQLAAMAARAFDLPESQVSSLNFKDVPPNCWAARAIAAVADRGLASGFLDGNFRPEELLTRAQAIVIFSQVLGRSAGSSTEGALSSYTDAVAVPDWAKPGIKKASAASIIVSYPDPNVIKPNTVATRGEVAAMMYQTLMRLGISLPPLDIGVVGSDDRPTVPRKDWAAAERVEIERLVLLPELNVFRSGDALLVRAFATPGAQANFTLPGIASAVPMEEKQPGIYEGSYVIKRGDQGGELRLAVTLRGSNGRATTQVWPQGIHINR